MNDMEREVQISAADAVANSLRALVAEQAQALRAERALANQLAEEIERLRAAGDALAEALEAVRDEHDACWCPDPRTEMAGTCELCAADKGWQEARREQ